MGYWIRVVRREIFSKWREPILKTRTKDVGYNIVTAYECELTQDFKRYDR